MTLCAYAQVEEAPDGQNNDGSDDRSDPGPARRRRGRRGGAGLGEELARRLVEQAKVEDAGRPARVRAQVRTAAFIAY
ncbi:hypothetical protein [Protofrankia symbiont of Coriaria ruscifolia]|uniref:hypothetical protein n=1 Tax=Protofrankia symbiont of Coriaria ruscifolia TaxID=1306542 RepID=UPI001040FC25|nr:hypothetical protein [Protofrankia symbiont of Coriaria ruscifolia]